MLIFKIFAQIFHFDIFTLITSIAAAAGGSRRRLPKAGVERSSYVGIAYTISVKLSNWKLDDHPLDS